MQLVDRAHEGSDADPIILLEAPDALSADARHKLLRPVVDCVELAGLVDDTNAFEESTDLLAGARHLEIVLADAHLSEGGGKEEVHCLWLVAIVVVVCH